MGFNGNGRKANSEKMSLFEYTQKILEIKDALIELQEDESDKKREYESAKNKVLLQEQKLNRAYAGLEDYRGVK